MVSLSLVQQVDLCWRGLSVRCPDDATRPRESSASAACNLLPLCRRRRPWPGPFLRKGATWLRFPRCQIFREIWETWHIQWHQLARGTTTNSNQCQRQARLLWLCLSMLRSNTVCSLWLSLELGPWYSGRPSGRTRNGLSVQAIQLGQIYV